MSRAGVTESVNGFCGQESMRTLVQQVHSELKRVLADEGYTQHELALLSMSSDKHVSLVLNDKNDGSFQFLQDCATVLGYRWHVTLEPKP